MPSRPNSSTGSALRRNTAAATSTPTTHGARDTCPTPSSTPKRPTAVSWNGSRNRRSVPRRRPSSGVSSESPVQPPAPCCWSPDFSSAARQDSKSPTFGSSSRRQRPPYTPKRRCSSFSRSRKRCGSRRRNPRSATMPPRSTSTKMPESRSRKRRWPHSTNCSYPTASRRP